ncbi:MAG: sigma-70 family RNA polymerase sigma factor [Alphaproteobacteria bacterium]
MRAIAVDRDRQAFKRVFDYYAPRVKAYAAQLGGRIDADELVQDVMLTIWRRAALYDPDRAVLSAWVFAIARNRRIDLLRSSKRAQLDPRDPAFHPAEQPAADDRLARTERLERLTALIEELPVEQRDLLKRSYFDDKSHSALADELGLPLGTVKSRLRLALARLRRAIEEPDEAR